MSKQELTLEQAAGNLEQLINQTALKKAEFDILFNSLVLLFNKAKEAQAHITTTVVENEQAS